VAFRDLNIVRVQTTPPCAVEAVIEEGVLVLTRAEARVEIPLPSDSVWPKVEYVFGNASARLQVWTYVPVRRE